LGSRDVIGHVTVGLGICGFLLAVHWNQASILHRYGDIGLQRFWGHKFDFLGSRDVIDHVTIGLGICDFLLVVDCNYASILHILYDFDVCTNHGKCGSVVGTLCGSWRLNNPLTSSG